MSITDIVKNLKLDENFIEVLRKDWESSESSFPPDVPVFLRPEEYRKGFEWSGIGQEMLPRLDRLSKEIRENYSLLHLAWHCYRKLFYYEDHGLQKWPLFKKSIGSEGALFYLLVALGMIPLVKMKYESLNIPDSYAQDACKVLNGLYGNGAGHRDSQDFDTKFLGWIRNYTEGKLFRIGRFEYMFRKMNWYKIEVYKNRSSGRIIAIAGDGDCFNKDGYILYPDEDKANAEFTSEIVRENSFVSGLPIDPFSGTVRNKLVKLKLDEWEKRIGVDDTILDMHIPGGEKMPLPACGDSFKKAFDFCDKYFPSENVSAIASVSWIFYKYYEDVLPNSNLAAFMRELYLFPYVSSGRDGVTFIFSSDEGDISKYRCGNTIQSVMVDVFKSGGRLRRGGMFFLREHIDLFGKKPYRTILNENFGSHRYNSKS